MLLQPCQIDSTDSQLQTFKNRLICHMYIYLIFQIVFLEANPEQSDLIQLLKVVVEPATKVLELWQQSYETRKRLFENMSLPEIFNAVPALKHQISVDLVS